MAQVSRRRLMGQAAAVAGGAALAGSAATHAAPSSTAGTRRASAQEKTEITIYHIWGTPPGGTPATSEPAVVERYLAMSEARFARRSAAVDRAAAAMP